MEGTQSESAGSLPRDIDGMPSRSARASAKAASGKVIRWLAAPHGGSTVAFEVLPSKENIMTPQRSAEQNGGMYRSWNGPECRSRAQDTV